jgi:SAM-dependent methyltransferase
VVHNLNVFPWPFQTNRFKEIIAHHVVEHLNDLPAVMDELYRICAPDGTIYIEVPHHSGWCAHSPEHKMFFNYFAFDGYVQNATANWITKRKFKLISREVTFHRSFRQVFLHKAFNRAPMSYERFWTHLFPAEHLKVRLQPIK